MSRVYCVVPPDPNMIEPFLSAERKQTPMGIGFPIGLGYIAAYLKEHGYEVKLRDALKDQWDIDQVLREIIAYRPDYVLITSFTVQIKVTIELAKKIKSCIIGPMVVLGGPHATHDYDNLLRNYPWFDYIVLGEGEKTTLELLAFLDTGGDTPDYITGLAYLRNGKIHKTPCGLLCENLDEFPFPARNLVDFDSYIERESVLPYQVVVMGSRGCTNRCVFCCNQKQWRGRSVANIISEIRQLIKDYPRMRSVAFMDDDFSANRERVIELCQAWIESGMQRLKWSCSCRVDQVDSEMLAWMKRANCVKVLYGLEAADDGLLRALNKHIDLDQVRKVVEETVTAGISTIVFVIMGNPGETDATIKRTYDFVTSLPCEAVAWSMMQVYPGTVLAKLLPQIDFSTYQYAPEVHNPHGIIHANIVVYEQPGLNREQLKAKWHEVVRKTVLHKIRHHPVYAMKKLFNMPRVAVANFLYFLRIIG